jgi:hypothetical protein
MVSLASLGIALAHKELCHAHLTVFPQPLTAPNQEGGIIDRTESPLMRKKILTRYRSRRGRRTSIAHYTVAIVAMLLLGLTAATMLVVQLYGYHIPIWMLLIPVISLLGVLWWVK